MTENKGANVFVIEDDKDISDLIQQILGMGPHKKVGEVYWVAAAMNAIGDFGNLGVQVVTIDQDICGGDVVKRGFIGKVRQVHPNIKLIGLSCCPMAKPVDYDLGKDRICELNQVISQLTR